MTIEETLLDWQKENFSYAYSMMREALEDAKEERDILKQKILCRLF